METIIGLLVILLPVIFKVIEKKLQQSGPQPAKEELPDLSELFGEALAEDEQPEPAPEPVRPVRRAEPLPKPAEMKRQTRKVKPILMEEPEKKREKIDPKKLVIYSEIMKPKYNE